MKNEIRNLAKEANATITAEMVDEFEKIAIIMCKRHEEEIAKYNNVLVRIAQCFYKDIGKVKKYDPDVLYTKIIWGIHDLMK